MVLNISVASTKAAFKDDLDRQLQQYDSVDGYQVTDLIYPQVEELINRRAPVDSTPVAVTIACGDNTSNGKLFAYSLNLSIG